MQSKGSFGKSCPFTDSACHDILWVPMEAKEVEGVELLQDHTVADKRGFFSKPYSSERFRDAGVTHDISEIFWSESLRGVLRGMHLQVGAAESSKTISVVSGEILDVVVDARRNSATFGMFTTFALSGSSPCTLFVPQGVAHGFLVISESATMLYSMSKAYNPALDGGFRFDTFGFAWPEKNPVVSERDSSLPSFEEFVS